MKVELAKFRIKSPYEIDHIHRAFGQECIDVSYGPDDPLPQVIMIRRPVTEAIDWQKPNESAVAWTGKDTRRSIKQK